MKEIWRKKLPLSYGVYPLSFPVGTQIVSADMKGEQVYVWGMFDKAKAGDEFVKQNVLITRSGLEFPDTFNRHLNTIVRGDKVWQVLTESNTITATVGKPEPAFTAPTVKAKVAKSKKVVGKKAIGKVALCKKGCKVKVHAKGLCQKCYDKVRRAK